MSSALSTGVTGLPAHQKTPDVAGNNSADVNSTAFKSGQTAFSELLSETMKKASQPISTVGGTNPQQIGSGAGISGISPNRTQGNIVNTGNPLDLAIEGEGYFVLSDGSRNIYTRAGGFAIDANSNLIDPSTGCIVQRIGSVGESDGFQAAGNSNINVPYDAATPAIATSSITMAGNLSSDATIETTQTNMLKSDITYTANDGANAALTTKLVDLDQFSGALGTTAAITATGYSPSGNDLSDTGYTVTSTSTIADLVDHLNTNVLTSTEQVASLSNGRIVITDVASGYSKSDLKLAFADDGTAALTMPGYFEVSTVGGEEVKNANITVYDSEGGPHVLSGAFVRTNTNTWDIILASITGDINEISFDNRRIEGIEFDANNSYAGLSSTTGDTASFTITFAHDTANPQTISVNLGTANQFNGLTQFSGSSTAVAREQDGYEASGLSTVSVNNEGTLIGIFSNGIKKNIAALQVALFQNSSGLESIGNGYFIPSANSGEAIAAQALTGGAGSIYGGSLEKSNADVATEFVNMIQAQNGFQVNSRSITVANEILRELTNFIR